jgi:SOS-response transcriptional repressor LexA
MLMRVQGDRLAPRLQSGDLLHVDPDRTAAPGDLIVARWDGMTLVGELLQIGEHRWLTALGAEPLVIGPTCEIAGVATGVFRELAPPAAPVPRCPV